MNAGGDAKMRLGRLAEFLFGAAALLCVLAGLLLYLFADSLGMDRDMAKIVAILFLAAGFADYLLLRFWSRIVKRRNRRANSQ